MSIDNNSIQTYNWKYPNFSINTRIKNLQLHWTRQHALRWERKRLKNESKIKRLQNKNMKQTNIVYYKKLNPLLTWNAAQSGLLPVKEACNLKELEVLAAIKRSPPNFRVKRKASYKNPISKFKISDNFWCQILSNQHKSCWNLGDWKVGWLQRTERYSWDHLSVKDRTLPCFYAHVKKYLRNDKISLNISRKVLMLSVAGITSFHVFDWDVVLFARFHELLSTGFQVDWRTGAKYGFGNWRFSSIHRPPEHFEECFFYTNPMLLKPNFKQAAGLTNIKINANYTGVP